MEVITWQFKDLFKGNPEKCYREVQTLEEVTPQNVLDFARNKKTELHKCFTWDDAKAAEKCRLAEARKIIQSFVIVHKDSKGNQQNVRSYQITTATNHYEPTRLFLQKPDEYTELLKRAKAELAAFRQRYKMLSELETIFAEIDLLEG